MGCLFQNIKKRLYFNSKPLIEFLIELNTRTKSNDKKKNILDLLDKFLLSNTLRFNTKAIIE